MMRSVVCPRVAPFLLSGCAYSRCSNPVRPPEQGVSRGHILIIVLIVGETAIRCLVHVLRSYAGRNLEHPTERTWESRHIGYR